VSGVVLLARDRFSTRIVFHRLRASFPDLRVVIEDGVSRAVLLRGRVRRLGLLLAAGQVLFSLAAAPLLRRAAAARIAALKREHALDDSPIPEEVVTRVPSVNSDEARAVLAALAPRVVVVNGTRIIGRRTLGCVDAPFLNMHAGITPLYRGVHGGYWAVAEGRPHEAGTTVHRVDEGIDTGEVLAQATFAVTPADSIATYPYLHLAAGLPLLEEQIRAALEGRLEARPPLAGAESRLRYHPTLWGYLWRRLRKGAR
jgi:folate-dependent phosphoribosylglycinamide formyltransferase PurN